MRRSSSPNSSVRWSRSTLGGSTSVWAVRPEPIKQGFAPYGAIPIVPMSFRRTYKSYRHFWRPYSLDRSMQAVPGGGLNVPLWILGSSTFGAQLAAHLGLPYAFASHFAPDALLEALTVYRARFQPSRQLEEPYAMIGVNVVAAETDEEARFLFTTVQQAFTNLARGRPGPQQPPILDIEQYWSPSEKLRASHMLKYAVVGAPDTVREGLQRLVSATEADELMVVSNIYDHAKRVRSYEIVAGLATAVEGRP